MGPQPHLSIGNYRKRIENWMELQRKCRIYDLGSMPSFLLVFTGNVEVIDHWRNQHGLGDDNVRGSCRLLHAGPVSLWSGKGKPWVRLESKNLCPLDHLWEPYDLHKPIQHDNLGEFQSLLAISVSTLIGFSSYLSG